MLLGIDRHGRRGEELCQPPADKPQWLALAQAVFNTQATRWDPRTCGGGLRWQTVAIADGYNYKNTISNGCFFNIAVRLARYTGNDPYAVWAEKTYDWLGDVKLINATTWDVHDDHQTATDCSDNREGLDDNRWSYNLGILLSGSVYLYNYARHTHPILTKFLADFVTRPTASRNGSTVSTAS